MKIIQSDNYSLVHVNDIKALRYAFAPLFLSKIPCIINIRGLLEEERLYNWKWLVVNITKAILTLSDEMRVQLNRRLPLFKNWNGNVYAIYSFVDFSRFKPSLIKPNELKEELGFNSGAFAHLVCVGVFSDLKNQFQLCIKVK